MDCSRVLDCARHTPILGGILAASCRPFCPSSTAGAVSPLTVTDTRVRSVFLASSATLLSWKAPSIGLVMVGPVRFAWLRRCSSAASVHRLCPDYNDAISREFQRVPAPSAQLARLHLVTIATNHPQLDSLPPDPPPPKAQLLGGAIKHADIRLDSVHHAALGTREVTARFYVPDSRARASFVANIAQRASTRSFLSRLRGGGAHTPASPQGRAGPSALSLQPSSSGMAGFSRQLHHAAPRRNPTSARQPPPCRAGKPSPPHSAPTGLDRKAHHEMRQKAPRAPFQHGT